MHVCRMMWCIQVRWCSLGYGSLHVSIPAAAILTVELCNRGWHLRLLQEHSPQQCKTVLDGVCYGCNVGVYHLHILVLRLSELSMISNILFI